MDLGRERVRVGNVGEHRTAPFGQRGAQERGGALVFAARERGAAFGGGAFEAPGVERLVRHSQHVRVTLRLDDG